MRYAVLALLLSAVQVFAAPPDVKKEFTVDAGQNLRIVIKTDKVIGYTASFGDEDAFFGELVSPVKGERHFVFQAPAKKPRSQYFLSFWTVGEAVGSPVTIMVGPTAVVEPVQPVTAKHLAIVVVEETAKRTQQEGKVLFDKDFRTWLTANKGSIELLDYDNAQVATNGYKTYADKVGLPAVLVFDADVKGAQKPYTFRLPATAAEFRSKCEGK